MTPLGRRAALAATVLALCTALASARPDPQDLPRGVVIDDVKCAADATQSYALYLPSGYTPQKAWTLLIAFHPAARGRAMVETYQAAAEQYGYIVAGSNNSRNGPWPVSSAAAQAIGADLGQRFSIDPQRMYATGMSGGARVAMMVALSNTRIAGVIASSAGYPDSQPRSNVPFAVFGTTGTEDFNYLEMRQLDRALKTPHHLAVFNGGHTLPPDNVAFEAIDWMELQAMKSGRRARDEALIDRLLQKRRAAVDASTSPTETVHLLDALVADFSGLRDVSSEAARAKDLAKQPDVKKALARERASDDAEARMLGDVFELEAALAGADRHASALMSLRGRLASLAQKARDERDSPERSQARRVLRSMTSGAATRTHDREYLALLDEYGIRGR